MKQGRESSYASKVSRNSSAEKRSVTIQEPNKKHEADVGAAGDVQVAGEKLMVSELVDEGVTCDEITHVPGVLQPQLVDPNLPQMPPGPVMMPSPGPGYYNMMTPPHVYSQGSPPLPLAGPLHLVYLQPTPHGVNIIPFQAAGFPTFSPVSPLGFPAHPHHPVVVQSPQPFHNPQTVSGGPDGFPPPVYDPSGMTYLPNNYAGFAYPSNEGVCVPPQDLSHKEHQTTYRSKKFFRPWEDKSEEEAPKMSKVAFVEDEFPSLQTGLSKLNLK